ncbi:hypothetical protein Tco_0076669, partial [Tanacetum coccineum]
MESLKKIKINYPLLKEIRQIDNYAKHIKDLVANKPKTEDDEEIRMNPSFIKGHTVKGVRLRVADSHTGNHQRDDFTSLETIRRGGLQAESEDMPSLRRNERRESKSVWEDVCLPKQEGVLGIRRIRTFNVAL